MLSIPRLFLALWCILSLFAPSVHASSITTYSETQGSVELSQATGEAFVYNSNGRITKLDSDGSVIWSFQYYSYAMDNPSQTTPFLTTLVKETSDGGCIVQGIVLKKPSNTWSRPYGLLMKINSDGTVAWLSRFEHEMSLVYAWSFGHFQTRDLIETSDGGYMISGLFAYRLSLSWGYLVKFDSTGNIEWNKRFYRGNAGKVAQTADGGYVFSSGKGYVGGKPKYIIKVDSAGNVEWQRRLSLIAPRGHSEIYGLANGSCVFISEDYYHWVIINLDENGNVQWQKKFNKSLGSKANFVITEEDGFSVVLGERGKVTLFDLDENGEFVQGSVLNTNTILQPTNKTLQVASTNNKTLISSIKTTNSLNPSIISIDLNGVGSDCMWVSPIELAIEDAQLNAVDTGLSVYDDFFHTTSIGDPSFQTASDIVQAEIGCSTNEPPTADAGQDMEIECASSTGTHIDLDASASFDTDDDSLSYTWDGPFGTVSGPSPTVTLPLGIHAITLTVDDGNGGTDSDQVVITVADTMPPSTSVVILGTAGNNNWYVSPVTIDLIATDICSGVASLNYSVNGMSQTISGKSVTIDLGEGINDISFYATDVADNVENGKQLAANIDLTSPVITINGVEESAIYPICNIPPPSYDTVDTLSGLANSSASIVKVSGTGLVSYSYNVTATDIAGNENNAEVIYKVVEGATGLIELVKLYLATGQIAPQMEVSLLSQVQNALKLKPFINHVQAQYGKKIDPVAADMLINSAICLSQ